MVITNACESGGLLEAMKQVMLPIMQTKLVRGTLIVYFMYNVVCNVETLRNVIAVIEDHLLDGTEKGVSNVVRQDLSFELVTSKNASRIKMIAYNKCFNYLCTQILERANIKKCSAHNSVAKARNVAAVRI